MDMNDKMRKAFIELNQNIDVDIDKTYQKLYDKFVNLELSHNRKRKALQKIEILMLNFGFLKEDVELRDKVLDICENALFCDGRERSKR